ncbi:SH3 domain-containing protein [Clostridium sp.]|uniref:C40 family peptidase n=1 Tax=Clostridium sp. TaxID=1506 RepID=UPI003217D911
MKDNTLKVLCTIATSAAIATSIQSIALAEPAKTPAAASTTVLTGSITADALNVRSNPSTSSSIIGSLSYNAKVSISETNNGWYKISYNNTTGWISSQYVNVNNNSSNTTTAPSTSGTVNATALNVRSGSSTSSKIVGSISKNYKVEIISTSNGWHKIKYNNGTGFVSADYITISSGSSSGDSNTGNDNNSSTKPTVTSNGVVNASALNVRSNASTNSSIIGSLSKNAKVEIISTSNGWHKIKHNNGTGFVSADYVTLSSSGNDNNTGTITPPVINEPSHTIEGKVAVINADALNVRSGAGTNCAVLTTVRYGNKLPVISYSNGWYNVKVGNITGYISGEYVTITNESEHSNPIVKETPLIESVYTGQDVVNKVEEYLGVPYLWGGFTPVGFDCSGLIQYVYKQLGMPLERTTYYQVHQGQTVDRSELQPGDLIFFTTNDDDPNDISHVGIYKGNDLFIQASKPGDVVRVSNLNSAYYNNRYYISKRIIK